jgi:hypothetical protein
VGPSSAFCDDIHIHARSLYQTRSGGDLWREILNPLIN